jgi:hypothetical protein
VSGRKKKLRRQVIDAMFCGAIGVPEARARMAWIDTGVYRSASGGGMAVKSANGYERLGAGMYRPPWRQGGGPVPAGDPGGLPAGYELFIHSTDPGIREGARAAAEQAMVTKALGPGRAPAGQQGGTARALVWARGPDGTFGYQQVRVPGPPGPPPVPPGVAGR